MASNSESELDRQFREDLEKATALSMETLAMDQFRRNKIHHSLSEANGSSIYRSNCKALISHYVYRHFQYLIVYSAFRTAVTKTGII